MTDMDKLRKLFPPRGRILPRWKAFGDNQPFSTDFVYCCPNPECNKGRLFEWQLTNYCPHCGWRLYKPQAAREETT